MKFKMIAMIAVAIFAVGATGSSASAQGCGCGGGGGYTGVVPGNYGGFGEYGLLGYDSTCGRAVTSSQAAGLWGDYCTDDCTYNGPQRQGLFGRHGGCGCGLKGRKGGCGGAGGFGGGCGCGFNQGCFGYPAGGCGGGCGGGIGSIGSYSGCGCGGGGGRGHKCGLKAKLAGLRSAGVSSGYAQSDCGCDTGGGGGCGHGHGCRLKAKRAALGAPGPHSSCGRGGCLSGGCHPKGRFFNKMLARHSRNPYMGFASTNASSCCSYLSSGCDSCGSNGGYFNEAVGYEYGNAGMQSYVNGSLTSACGGGCGCGN